LSILRWKGAGRRWQERWLSKINSNWSKHRYCCWFGQKWPLNASGMIAESLNIPKTVVLRILKEDLGKRKLCARYVSHSLTPEQRENRVTSCQDLIAMAEADKNFFNKIITEDEAWCFAYDPETKRQSSEWVGKTSPRLKKLKFQRPHIKTMLIIILPSRHSAQRIRIRGKNSKCRIL
jgi:hypothetical protein